MQKWYQKATVQSALIGAAALVLAAIITAVPRPDLGRELDPPGPKDLDPSPAPKIFKVAVLDGEHPLVMYGPTGKAGPTGNGWHIERRFRPYEAKFPIEAHRTSYDWDAHKMKKVATIGYEAYILHVSAFQHPDSAHGDNQDFSDIKSTLNKDKAKKLMKFMEFAAQENSETVFFLYSRSFKTETNEGEEYISELITKHPSVHGDQIQLFEMLADEPEEWTERNLDKILTCVRERLEKQSTKSCADDTMPTPGKAAQSTDHAEEEDQFEKALLKAREELKQARDARAEALKKKITLLEEQFREAHGKKERAIARAQLTKSGHVYVISNIGSFGEDVFKIGMTRRLEPLDRVKELGDASVPFPFDVHAMVYSEDAPDLESKLHTTFLDSQVNLINQRKELFRITLNDVQEAVEKLSPDVEFITTAVAEQFRASTAIRKKKELEAQSDREMVQATEVAEARERLSQLKERRKAEPIT